MKRLIFLLALISCQACMDNVENYCVNVLIHNKTAYNLKIEGFKKGKSIKTIEIAPQETDEKLINALGLDTFLGISGSQIDSVALIFNNNKVIVQYCNGKSLGFCDNITKNIELGFDNQFIGGAYKILKKNGCKVYKKPIEITFDQSDYDRAVPIKQSATIFKTLVYSNEGFVFIAQIHPYSTK
jgi:hypothetical protein